MNQSYVAATRQELLKLKEKFKSAKRGHKLLKDKRDSLIQIFMQSYREAGQLRALVDREYIGARERFKLASADMSDAYVRAIADTSEMQIAIQSKIKNIMGVKVQELTADISGDAMTYSQLETNYHLDDSIYTLSGIVPRVMELIEKEYRVRKLAEEIEKTRKRVNALEYVILPELKAHIKLITAKLDELALQNTVRLMKIKQQITKES